MTAPLPPTSGPTSPQERLAAEDHGTPPDIQASLPDLSGVAAAAEAAGEAWCAAAGELTTSGEGYGGGGRTITDDAAANWPTDMSFPHQGP